MFWNKKKKIRIIGFGSFLILVLIALQLSAKKMVESFLNGKLPPHVHLEYVDISVNIFSGSVVLRDFNLSFANRETNRLHSSAIAKKFSINGLKYWPFFFKKKLKADRIALIDPNIVFRPYNTGNKETNDTLGVVDLIRTITIDNILLENGSFTMLQEAADSVLLKVHDIGLAIENITTGPEIIKSKIPVIYDDFHLNCSNVLLNLGPFENLGIKQVSVEEKNIHLDSVSITSKYTKKELSKMLKEERDHIDFLVSRIRVEALDFGFEKNDFFLKTDLVTIMRPLLRIYRDKTLPDDLSIKPLYNQALRKLPITLVAPRIILSEGHVDYEERLEPTGKAGSLFINAIDAKILGIDNRRTNQNTVNLLAKCRFMDEASFDFDYSFKLGDPTDSFVAKGSLYSLPAASFDSFLKPNLNVKAKGFVDELYFTVSGDPDSSSGDMKMKYNDFKFQMFRGDGKGVDKILTVLGNLFISDGHKADEQGYRYGEIETEREKNKSFFNYLWLNMKNGMISTMTGSGKKSD